jgi:hypothetical protein
MSNNKLLFGKHFEIPLFGKKGNVKKASIPVKSTNK